MKTAASHIRPGLSIRQKTEYAIAAVLRRFGLYSLVHALYGRLFKRSRERNPQTLSADFRPEELAQLTPYARDIYANLKFEISKRKRGEG